MSYRLSKIGPIKPSEGVLKVKLFLSLNKNGFAEKLLLMKLNT